MEADILKKELIEKILSDYNPDLIIHLAAIHHIPTAEANPKETLSFEGTCNILDIMENIISKVNLVSLLQAEFILISEKRQFEEGD